MKACKKFCISLALVGCVLLGVCNYVNAAELSVKRVLARDCKLKTEDIARVENLSVSQKEAEKCAVVTVDGKKVEAEVQLQKIVLDSKNLLKNAEGKGTREIYVVSAKPKCVKGSKGHLSARMYWIDNSGPVNELYSVSASTTNRGCSGNYYYRHDYSFGTAVYGTWSAPSFSRSTPGYKGLNLEFSVTMSGASIVLSNSVFQ